MTAPVVTAVNGTVMARHPWRGLTQHVSWGAGAAASDPGGPVDCWCEGRALVTANIKDFVPLDGRYRAAGQSHAGLILVSTKTFPQNRGFPSAITASLVTLLSDPAKIQSGQVLFLMRG